MSSKLKTILYGGTLQYPLKDPEIIIGDSDKFSPGTLVDANKVTQMINNAIQDLVGNSPENLDTLYELAAKVNSTSNTVDAIKDHYWFQSSKNITGIKIKNAIDTGTDFINFNFIRQWLNSNNDIETRIESNGKCILKHSNKLEGEKSSAMYDYELFEGKIKANPSSLYLGGSIAQMNKNIVIHDSANNEEVIMKIGSAILKNETYIDMVPGNIEICCKDGYSEDSNDKVYIKLDDAEGIIMRSVGGDKLYFQSGLRIEGSEGTGSFLNFDSIGNVFISRYVYNAANEHNKRIIHYSTTGGDEQDYIGHVLYYYGINGNDFITCTENKNKINIPQTTFEAKDAVNKEYVDSLFTQLNERINNLVTN